MIERLIHELRDRRMAAAVEAMENPGGGSIFAYGRSVGTYAGLVEAESIIQRLLNDEDEKERKR